MVLSTLDRRNEAFSKNAYVILFYAKGKDAAFNMLKEPYSEKSKHKGARFSKFVDGELQQSYTDDTSREKAMRDVWEISYLNSQSKERKKGGSYPTIKPLALLNRIILASSNVGDMVLDPFCGCATTCEAADNHGRQWVGIDISTEAARLVQNRISTDIFRRNFKQYDTLPILTDRKPPRLYNDPYNITIMYGRQAGYCFLCFNKKDVIDLCVDHIVAKSRGGSDFLDNLQLVCHKCNSKKGNKTNEEALAIQWKEGGVEWERRKHEAERQILIALKKNSKIEIM